MNITLQSITGQYIETIEETKKRILEEVSKSSGIYPEYLAGKLGISPRLASDLTTEMIRNGELGTR